MSLHTRRIGPDAGEMLEGPHRLPDHHAATVEGAAAALPGGTQKLGLKREIDDFRHPHFRPQQRRIERQTGMSSHSHRSGVDQAVRAFHRRRKVIGGRDCPAGVVSCDSAREHFGTLVIPVDDEELLHSEAHRGVSDGRTRPPGTEEHHAPPPCVAQLLPEGHGEARAIGVEAFAPTFAEDDRVDGADGVRVLGQLGQQRQHGLLARVRDVEAAEARRLDRVDQPRQIGDTAPVLGEIDQPIVQGQAVVLRFLLVQSRRKGFLDSLSDQADQKVTLRRPAGCRTAMAHFPVSPGFIFHRHSLA